MESAMKSPVLCTHCDWHGEVKGMNNTELRNNALPILQDHYATAHPDPVDHPPHYNANPSGVECITVVEHMGFNVGNAIKYLWRADEKGNALEDLRKAAWYVDREIQRREQAAR